MSSEATADPSQAARPARRRWGRRLAALALGLVLALLAVELGYRVLVFGPAGLVPAQMNSVRPLGNSGLIQASETPGVAYELKPDQRARFKLVPFDTNAHGMRDVEVAREKPAGVRRAVVLGDSFTMGSGVPIEECWHSRLERSLSEADPDADWECLNFGVGGYGLWEYVNVLREKGLAFEPDLVLVGITRNDRIDTRRQAKAFKPKPEMRPFLESQLWRELSRKLDARRLQRLELESQSAADEPRRTPRELAFLPRNREHILDRFGELRELGEQAGAPVVVAYLDAGLAEDEPESWFARLFREACEETGLRWVDTSQRFRGRSPDEYRIYATDHHPNGEANAGFAAAIHDALVEAGLVGEQ